MTSDSVVRAPSSVPPTAAPGDLDRTVDWRRLVWTGHGVAVLALCAMVFGAILQSVSTVVSGRLAANPSWSAVLVLAGCLIGSAIVDTAGRTVWATMVDRAEG